jgi:precorrin-6A/cobalt-precorrin-6A reductase
MRTATVLLLGGTWEARQLAETLAARPELRVVTSLAGRVERPILPRGEVRIGGFGGVDGLTDWIQRERAVAVVDATHPFAARISTAASTAASRAGVRYLMLHRPAWSAQPGDTWCRVPSMEAAADAVAAREGRVFLTTGRRLGAFAHLDRQWFLIRSVSPPDPPLPPHREVILERGPFDLDHELDLLGRHRIQMLVTKNSGGQMTGAKLVAARMRGLTVVMVDRPPRPQGPFVESVDAAAAWVGELLSST